MRGGILVETRGGPATEIEFSHALIHSAVYDDLGSARRRRMHRAAVTIVGWDAGLAHRLAAATGPDAALADDLEVAAGRALRQRQSAQAASWLAQAAIASDRPSERDRRTLDALEVLIDDGAVADAEAMLVADEHPPAHVARLSAVSSRCSPVGRRRRARACWMRGRTTTHRPTPGWAPEPR